MLNRCASIFARIHAGTLCEAPLWLHFDGDTDAETVREAVAEMMTLLYGVGAEAEPTRVDSVWRAPNPQAER